MTLEYLVTGATGGIGTGVLVHFQSISLDSSLYAAASSNASSAEHFASRNIQFRHADYNDQPSLETAFAGVKNLLFVSSNTFDNELRGRQHKNVIDAAKKAGVGHIWYTSLAFGGYRDNSKVDVMAAHLVTERLLRNSGLSFTSIREGFYADAFPLFINWYPSTTQVYVPSDGPMAFTGRDELAEATAKIMLKADDIIPSDPSAKKWREKQVVLFTAPRTYTLRDLVDFVNQATGRDVKFSIVSADEYVARAVDDDLVQGGAKPRAFWEKRISWFDGVSVHRDGETLSPEMEEVLGRTPLDGKQVIMGLLAKDRDYTWHQNYARQGAKG